VSVPVIAFPPRTAWICVLGDVGWKGCWFGPTCGGPVALFFGLDADTVPFKPLVLLPVSFSVKALSWSLPTTARRAPCPTQKVFLAGMSSVGSHPPPSGRCPPRPRNSRAPSFAPWALPRFPQKLQQTPTNRIFSGRCPFSCCNDRPVFCHSVSFFGTFQGFVPLIDPELFFEKVPLTFFFFVGPAIRCCLSWILKLDESNDSSNCKCETPT